MQANVEPKKRYLCDIEIGPNNKYLSIGSVFASKVKCLFCLLIVHIQIRFVKFIFLQKNLRYEK